MDLSLTREASTAVWNALADQLGAFTNAWKSRPAPPLGDYLPAGPPVLRRLTLVELIKVDLELRAAGGLLKPLEEYVREFPELLEDGAPPADIIYEDYHVRRVSGLPVTAGDYCDRYPRIAAALRRLIGDEHVQATTSLFAGGAIPELAPGERLDDFELLVELGKGAFGAVYLARQVSMQRLVALKVSADKGQEPQTLAQLDHANIVRVYDQRRLPERGVRLLYMQFAPGGTLADVVEFVRRTPATERSGATLLAAVTAALDRTGTMPTDESRTRQRLSQASWPETVCRIGIQLAQALDYAHRQGVLHRDVKPANVLLAADGSPKLADFNISFCSQLDGASPAAFFGGSLAYMSPEQLEACDPQHARQADEVDGRSDLYSLAVLLWELLYGERPFQDERLADGWSATLQAMVQRRRREPPRTVPGVSDDPLAARLNAVLRTALNPEPTERHADGRALARELALCLHPRAWDLWHGWAVGWRRGLRRWPLVALILVNLPPFALAGAFNFLYNYWQLIEGRGRQVEQAFDQVQFVINMTSFPLGVLLGLAYAWPFAATMRRLADGATCEVERRQTARRRALRLGYFVAAVGTCEWLAAGLAFPVSLHALVGQFPLSGYLHFFVSHITCGFVAAGLPFLITTWLAVRVFYPSLLGSDVPADTEIRQLAVLPRHAGYSLVAAAVVPMLALIMLLPGAREPKLTALTVIFLILSLGVFLAAYGIYGWIRRDLAALSLATRPADTLALTDSFTGDEF